MRFVKRDIDPVTNIVEDFYYDELTGKVVIHRVQDVQPNLDVNKEMFNSHNRASYGDSNGQHLVARIPLIVIEQWKEQGFDWFQLTDKERRTWLDKPENALFKVRPGKLASVTGNNKLTTKAS